MPKPNYDFERRQRELAKKKKQEEKRLKKQSKSHEPASEGEAAPPTAEKPAT